MNKDTVGSKIERGHVFVCFVLENADTDAATEVPLSRYPLHCCLKLSQSTNAGEMQVSCKYIKFK